jgi:4-hydroxy-3-methylbut-2-enyl diphosphate reductase IspH
MHVEGKAWKMEAIEILEATCCRIAKVAEKAEKKSRNR